MSDLALTHDNVIQAPVKKKGLKSFFNKVAKALPSFVIGAGTIITVKMGTVALLATAPVWATLVAAASAVAFATVSLEHTKTVHSERKMAKELGGRVASFARGGWKDYFKVASLKKNALSKETGYKALFNAAATLAGGLAVMAFDAFDVGDKLADLFGIGETQAAKPVPVTLIAPPIEAIPEPVIPEAVIPEAVIPVELSALDKVAALLDGIETNSILAQETLLSARAGGMWAVKDMAYFLFNGLEGLPKTTDLAAELFALAAEHNNIQAQVDVAYIQYHGLVPEVIAENKEQALKTINELGRSWVGGEALLEGSSKVAKLASVSQFKL